MLRSIKYRSSFLILVFFIVSCKTKSITLTTYIHKTNEEKELLYEEEFTKNYKLKKYQDYEFEENFKNKIEEIYEEIYSIFQVTFTYKLIPQGAIYSFSDIEIKCIPDKKSKKAFKACSTFLESIDKYYEKIKGELNENI